MQRALKPPRISRANKLGRLLWGLVEGTLFRYSPRPLHAWRAFLLRLFGARLGKACHIYAGARIWAPWNLECADAAAIGDGAEIYNFFPISLGAHAVVSQGAYLCGGTHEVDDPDFTLVAGPIRIGARAWIAARAVVMPGVNVGEGAVLALGSLATRDLEPWTVYAGSPARKIRERKSC
jgi:putative colanic acid biosynthesis acetyltransferase WcaF